MKTLTLAQALVGACIKIFVGAVTADCLGGVIETTPPLLWTIGNGGNRNQKRKVKMEIVS